MRYSSRIRDNAIVKSPARNEPATLLFFLIVEEAKNVVWKEILVSYVLFIYFFASSSSSSSFVSPINLFVGESIEDQTYFFSPFFLIHINDTSAKIMLSFAPFRFIRFFLNRAVTTLLLPFV